MPDLAVAVVDAKPAGYDLTNVEMQAVFLARCCSSEPHSLPKSSAPESKGREAWPSQPRLRRETW
jgi:hypothetical protein